MSEISEKPKRVREIKPQDQIKLIFSSLFARQMTSVIVGAEEDDNVLYFSNISLDEVDMYEQDASKYIHRVTIFNQRIMDALYELCPLCKDHILYIDTKAFLLSLTKIEDTPYQFEVTPTNALVISTDTEHTVVGQMISAYTSSLYMEIFKLGAVTDENMYEKYIEPGTISTTQISMHTAYNNKQQTQMTRVAQTPAKNFVSLKEYVPKAKLTGYVLTLRVYGEKACHIECDFHTDDIKVQSVQPGIRYYCKPRI